jgi:hypothetical protein
LLPFITMSPSAFTLILPLPVIVMSLPLIAIVPPFFIEILALPVLSVTELPASDHKTLAGFDRIVFADIRTAATGDLDRLVRTNLQAGGRSDFDTLSRFDFGLCAAPTLVDWFASTFVV